MTILCTSIHLFISVPSVYRVISPRSSNCFLQGNERVIRIQLKFRLKYPNLELLCCYFQLFHGFILDKPQFIKSFRIFFFLKNDLTLLVPLPRMLFFTRQHPSHPQTLLKCQLFYKTRFLEPVVRMNHSLVWATRTSYLYLSPVLLHLWPRSGTRTCYWSAYDISLILQLVVYTSVSSTGLGVTWEEGPHFIDLYIHLPLVPRWAPTTKPHVERVLDTCFLLYILSWEN